MPPTKTTGKKTASVVSVEALIAVATSDAPFTAASLGGVPPWTCRTMFSRTTIELSTSIPIPSASPLRVIRLRVSPPKYSKAIVASTETGIDSAITTTLPKLSRKANSTATARAAPHSALEETRRSDVSMNSAWFIVTANSAPAGSSSVSSASSAATARATWTVLAPEVFCTLSTRQSTPLSRERDPVPAVVSVTVATSLSLTGTGTVRLLTTW